MPIDLEKESAESGCTLTALRRWPGPDHEVALVRFEKKDADPPYADTHLVCECDFAYEDVVRDGKVVGKTHPKDPHRCRSKKAVMRSVQLEAKPKFQAMLREDGLKAAILAVHASVSAGEYLGQTVATMIYAQEVGELLDAEMSEIRSALDELFAEEKLDLNGMILAEYVRRFRFPKEIQALFIMMIEEPLGWPNGDAGDCFLAELEGTIHAHTRFKHGADAFWPHNYPRVAAHHLVQFGRYCLAVAAERAARDPKVLDDLGETDRLAAELESIAAKFRSLAKPPSKPPRPRKRRTKKPR